MQGFTCVITTRNDVKVTSAEQYQEHSTGGEERESGGWRGVEGGGTHLNIKSISL